MLKKLLTIIAMLYAAASFAAVDVNKATSAELDSIKGIGPGISTKILDERKKGNFKDWNDFIDRVKGVGEANGAKFSAEGMTVNGASFKGVAPTPAAAAPVTKTGAPAASAATPAAATPMAKPAVPAVPAAKEEVKDPKAAAKQAKADEKAKKAEEAKAKKEADKMAKADKLKAKTDATPGGATDAKK